MSAARPPNTAPVDLVAVRRCDRVFDALAARQDASFDDPAVNLLNALVVDVDADLPEHLFANQQQWSAPLPSGAAEGRGSRSATTPLAGEAATPGSEGPGTSLVRLHPRALPVDSPAPRLDRRRRFMAARAALTAGVAAAALATTGVAAAAIGTFAPIERIFGASEQSTPVTSPEPVVGQVRQALTTARRQLDQGQLAAAQQTLRLARQRLAGVHGEEAAALAEALGQLETRLAHETAAAQRPATNDRRKHPGERSSAVPGHAAASPGVSRPPAAGGNGVAGDNRAGTGPKSGANGKAGGPALPSTPDGAPELPDKAGTDGTDGETPDAGGGTGTPGGDRSDTPNSGSSGGPSGGTSHGPRGGLNAGPASPPAGNGPPSGHGPPKGDDEDQLPGKGRGSGHANGRDGR